MIKKLTALFAVLTAVCVLAIIPLAPFAMRDLANAIIPQYNQMKAVLPVEIFPLEDNITTLSLSAKGNYTVDTIYITHNETKEIIVKSNQLSQSQLTVNSSTQGDTISIFLVQNSEPFNILSMESPSDIWNELLQMSIGTAVIEISIPDGLILTDEKGEALLDLKNSVSFADSRPIFEADWNVKYLQREDSLPIETDTAPRQEPDFEDKVKSLRSDLLELVQTNARGGYSQLEFNMNLNDCHIRMEALLLEYAEQEGLINYDKYKDQPPEQQSSSSKTTGLSAKRNQEIPVDESVDEAEAKAVIRELSALYLSRLVTQAKLDLMPTESEAWEREALEQKISDDTRQIEAIEEKHTEFVAGLIATGLLF